MKRVIFSLFLAVLLSSCSESYFFGEEKQIPSGKWSVDSVTTFTVNIEDTVSAYYIFLSITNGEEYFYRNLYIFMTIKFPHNIVRVDTIDCMLADEKGKWYGKEVDDNRYRNFLLYRKNVRFPYKGRYEFELEQAMRHRVLEGIYSVGLYIKKVTKQ